MRRTLAATVFAVFLVAPLSSGFAASAATTTDHDIRSARSGDDDTPRVARDQRRPSRVIHKLDCTDPAGCLENVDPGGGNGYTSGACNCSRACNNTTAGCALSNSSNACQTRLGGGCDTCLVPSTCP